MPLGSSPTAIATVAAVTATSLQVADANANRGIIRLYNGGPNEAYVTLGPTAQASRGLPLPSGAQLIDSKYTGPVAAITGASGLTSNLFRVDEG